MRDDPGLDDVYYGADMNFAVAEPAPYRSGSFAQAQAQVPDAWNSPVAFQPLTTHEARPVEQASVSPEPLIDDNK
jgi:hypothetical protein